MKMQKHITALKKLKAGDDNYVPASPAERVSMIWPLTLELWSLKDPVHAKQRFQKHITRLIRMK
jgi:hypothetical protein